MNKQITSIDVQPTAIDYPFLAAIGIIVGMNTMILACSAGSPELLIFPAILGAILAMSLIVTGVVGSVGVIFKLGNAIEKRGEHEAAGGLPPLPKQDG